MLDADGNLHSHDVLLEVSEYNERCRKDLSRTLQVALVYQAKLRGLGSLVQLFTATTAISTFYPDKELGEN